MEKRRKIELTKITGPMFRLQHRDRGTDLFDKGREGDIMPEEIDEYMAHYASPIERTFGKPMWKFTRDEELQMEAQSLNDIPHELTAGERKYRNPCPVCKNRGYVTIVKDGRLATKECECVHKKAVKSEEYALLAKCRFENYRIGKDWQKDALQRAKAWTQQTKYSLLYLGGRPGCGKTHLAAAAYGAMLKRGKKGECISWREASRDLKMRMKDYENFYEPRISHLKNVPVLFVDDILWTPSGGIATDEDFRIMKELLDARVQKHLPTILTSNYTPEDLYGLSEEIGGRVYEAAGSKNNFAIGFEKTAEDYRIRDLPVTDATQADCSLFDVAGGQA